MGIRAKFIVTLVLAAIVPLALALISLRHIGERYYLNQQGNQFAIMAHDLANGVRQTLSLQVNHLYHDLRTSNIAETLQADYQPAKSPQALLARIEQKEKAWAQLSPAALRAYSEHATAKYLKDIQVDTPLYVEMFVTDRDGCVVGLTNKTSDYWQADEAWWNNAMGLKPGQVFVSGITYDQSSGVYAYEITLPIYLADQPEPVGVVKAVLNAAPLLEDMLHAVKKTGLVREVILENGHVFIHVDHEGRTAMEHPFPIEALRQAEAKSDDGFVTVATEDLGEMLVGFSPVVMEGHQNTRIVAAGAREYIVVHKPIDQLLSPVKSEMDRMLVFGVGSTILLFFIGWYIADRRILFPLTELEKAASTLSQIAFDPDQKQVDVTKAQRLLSRVKKTKSRDEFERLNTAFALMAERALFYRDHMQQEVMDKTAEIQKDLTMARHFQQALLPDRVPHITALGEIIPYDVSFGYRYQPCVTLGGDFFDVITLSDHEVAVFIADVMGHGATSALVTSMLRTLLHSESLLRDPAAQMNYLHEGFREIIERMSQPFFVTCSLMVFNAQTGKITYCSAGHPAPLLMDENGTRLLYDMKCNQPAVGLIPDMHYTSQVIDMPAPARIVLYTDGMIESLNQQEDEYGLEGLRKALRGGAEMSLEDLTEHLMQHWRTFLGTAEQADDVCLVTVEVKRPGSV